MGTPSIHHSTSSIVAGTEWSDQLTVWECQPDPITPICGFINVNNVCLCMGKLNVHTLSDTLCSLFAINDEYMKL